MSDDFLDAVRVDDAVRALQPDYRAVLPVGGEDLDAYAGPMRLVRAAGDEPFDTTAGGEPVVEHPEPGEVVWRDDAGVTCRRWNWRQCTRTRLTTTTTRAVLVVDTLTGADPEAAGAALAEALAATSPAARIRARVL